MIVLLSSFTFLLTMVVSSQRTNIIKQDAFANTGRSTPLPTPIVSSTKTNQGLELLSIPRHEEECKKVWQTQVLLPIFLNSKEICFAGSYRPELDYEAIDS